MKLRIFGIQNEIEFNKGYVNVLSIEDTKLYTNIINEFNERVNSDEYEKPNLVLLDDNMEYINVSNNVYLVNDIFNINYSDSKVLNKIYKMIVDNIDNNQDYVIEKNIVDIRNYIIQEINELPFEFTMNTEIKKEDLLKGFHLKIDNTLYKTVFEKLEFLINLLKFIEFKSILVIPNLKLYLTEDELLEFYKYSIYNEINVLIIERKTQKSNDYEKVLVIDNTFDDYYI